MNLLVGVLCGALALGGGLLFGRATRTGRDADFAWATAMLILSLILVFSLTLA